MPMRKSKLFVIMLCLCIGLCACQTPQEDTPPVSTSPLTEAVMPTAEPTKDVTPTETPATTLEPVVPQAFEETVSSARVVVDGIVHTCDIYVADGLWYISAEDAEVAFGETSRDKYVSLDAYAQTADISYEQDTVLNAAYFSTWEPYVTIENSYDFERAFQLGLVPEGLKKRASEQITSTEFRNLLVDLITQLAPDKKAHFDENVTLHEN